MKKRILLVLVVLLTALSVSSGAVASSNSSHVSPPTLSSPASLPNLAGCFNHRGIAVSGFISYECIFQPSGLGGALYWSANESNFNWDKHPGSGLLWVEASTLHPASDANPPNPFQAFWVGIPVFTTSTHQIASPGEVGLPAFTGAQPPVADFCNVINPGVGNSPTTCAIEGVVQTMTPQMQASYNQFTASMKAANLPTCAWSDQPVSNEIACDIDQAP